ncbi:Pentatricopeptide repeat-containing protein [Abeliophyllum distichum]|uniref:Pentatricopeptide repeat-containing protein n=1 Tax=Abeliophyllum distichum TaxID=126358 RepID=A0ABD1V5H1_9LAMI
MFSSNGTREFLKNLRPFFGFLISTTKPFSSERIFKQKKPIKKIHQKTNKSPKLSVRKENVDPKVYMRDIISKVYNILKYSTWDSAQEQLENLCIKWDSYTVNQVLKTHPPMEKAWLFFNWASGRKNFKHDQYTYTTMLDIFGEARRISSMKYVFQQMQEKGIKIDVVTYTSLLHWMSNDGDVDGAVKFWEEMKLKGCRPTVVSYTAYMKILFDHKRVKVATEVYKEMLQSGLSPNCYTYTVLMEHLACSGKFNEALELFSKMQEAGVQPDKATCNILVEICCRTGETWAMMKILQYMKENFLVLRYSVYQKTLETLKMAGESVEILRQVNQHFVIEHIKEEKTDKFGETASGNCSNVDNGLVLNLINKQNLVAVDYLLADMMDRGVQLDSKIISTIIELNSANCRRNSALFAFEYSVKLGLNVDRIAYLALIGLSIRTNSFSKAVEIVEEMVREGHSLGTQQSALLIYHLGCNRDPVSAAKLFSVLPDGEKTTSAYSALIGAYFSSGNANKGLETLQIMKNNGINVALGTYCVLVAGLEKCGRASELEFYRKEKKRMQAERNLQAVSMEETIFRAVATRTDDLPFRSKSENIADWIMLMHRVTQKEFSPFALRGVRKYRNDVITTKWVRKVWWQMVANVESACVLNMANTGTT